MKEKGLFYFHVLTISLKKVHRQSISVPCISRWTKSIFESYLIKLLVNTLLLYERSSNTPSHATHYKHTYILFHRHPRGSKFDSETPVAKTPQGKNWVQFKILSPRGGAIGKWMMSMSSSATEFGHILIFKWGRVDAVSHTFEIKKKVRVWPSPQEICTLSNQRKRLFKRCCSDGTHDYYICSTQMESSKAITSWQNTSSLQFEQTTALSE